MVAYAAGWRDGRTSRKERRMEYVQVPVPVDRVQEVYGLLAKPARAGAPQTKNGAAEWAKDGIVRMYRESPEPMRAALDYLAANPGREVSSDEMANAVGQSPKQWSGVLGAFGHRLSSRYRWTQWPFERRWSTSANRTVYAMTAEVAEIIKEAHQG
jgi:uncharacterized protein DUF6416